MKNLFYRSVLAPPKKELGNSFLRLRYSPIRVDRSFALHAQNICPEAYMYERTLKWTMVESPVHVE